MHAQIISPRSVFTDEASLGHTTLSDAAVDHPTLFLLPKGGQDTNAATWRERSLSLNFGLSSTVRTRRAGRHIGDLYGYDTGLALTYAVPRLFFSRPARLDLRFSGGSENGVLQDVGSGKRTVASFNDGETSLRMAFPIGTGAAWVGYEADNLWIPGNSDTLGGTLPLFDTGTSPHFNWHWARRGGFLGGCAPLGHSGVVVQGDFSPHLVFPGSFAATATTSNLASTTYSGGTAPAQVTLPFDTSGNGWDLTAQAPLGTKNTVLVWTGRFDASGDGTVTRDDLPSTMDNRVGPESSTMRQTRAGIALTRQLRLRSEARPENLTVTYHGSWTSFSTIGRNLPTAPLGYVNGEFDAAYYHAVASVVQRSVGVTWDKPLNGGRSFGLDYRWLETPILVDYGFAGRIFLIFVTENAQWAEPNARGHLLQARYNFPLGRVKETEEASRHPFVRLAALQIVPLPTTRHNPNAIPPLTPQPARKVSGGWALSASLTKPF